MREGRFLGRWSSTAGRDRFRRQHAPVKRASRRPSSLIEALELRLLLSDVGDVLSSAELTGIGPGPTSVAAGGYLRNETLGDGPFAAQDVDLYRFDVNKTLTIHAETDRQAGVPADTNTVLRLFDPAGNELAHNDDKPGSLHSRLDYYVINPGTYYVGVSGAGNAAYNPATGAGRAPGATGSYAINIQLIDQDVGDTIATAFNTQGGAGGTTSTYTESIGNGAGGALDVDVYRFNATVGDQFFFSTSQPAGGAAMSTSLRLFDTAGSLVGTSSELSGYGSLAALTTSTGPYYLAVSRTSGGVGDYQLSVVGYPSLADVSDTLGGALPVTLLPLQASTNGYQNVIGNGATPARDVDLYKTVIGEGDSLTVTTSLPANGIPLSGIAIRLFDAGGALVAQASGTGSGATLSNYFSATGGAYYIGISGTPNLAYDPAVAGSGSDGAVGSYAIQLNLTPSIDWGDVLPDARVTGLSPGGAFTQPYEKVGNYYIPNTDVDLFRFDAPKGFTLRAITSRPFFDSPATDTVLRLFDEFGNPIAVADNAPGTVFSSLNYTFARAGRFYLGVSGAGNIAYNPVTSSGLGSGATGPYRLDMQLLLTDVGDSTATAEPTQVGSGLAGAFYNESIGNGSFAAKDVDLYQLQGSAGDAVSAVASLPDGALATSVAVRLFDSTGNELSRSTNASGYGSVQFILPASGTYYVGVSGLPNLTYSPGTSNSGIAATSTGEYRLDLAVTAAPADAGDRLADATATGVLPGVAGTFNHSQVIGNGPQAAKDVDLFRFDAADGDLINVTLSLPALGVPAPLVLRLFNAAGSEVAQAIGTASVYPSLSNVRLFTGGTYYVGVSGAPNAAYDATAAGSGVAGATGSYALSLNLIPAIDAAATITGATFLDIHPNHTGVTIGFDKISPATDVDLFRIDAQAGQTLRAQTLNPGGGVPDANTLLRLFNSSGTQLALNDNGPSTTYSLLDFTFTTAGTYYLGVSGSGNASYNPVNGAGAVAGATGAYSLRAWIDVADTASQAEPVLAAGASTLTGRIGDGLQGLKDVDLYRFTMAAAGAQVRVNTSTPAGGVATPVGVRLFDSTGVEVAVSAPAGGFGSLNLVAPAAGTYYIGISGPGNVSYNPLVSGSGASATSTGDYQLDLNLVPPPDDPGDSFATSWPLPLAAGVSAFSQRNDVIGSGAFGRKDVDIYRLNADQGDVFKANTLPIVNGTPVALRLRLLASNGTLLSDVAGTAQQYPQIASYLFTEPGRYYLAVSGASNASYDPFVAGSGLDGPVGNYTLYTELAAPTDAGGTIASASDTGLALNAPYTRAFEKLGDVAAGPGDIDLYKFTSPGTQSLRIRSLNPYGVTPDTDTLVRLFDSAGNQIASADAGAGGSLLAGLDFTIAAPGTYYVGVSGAPNASYNPSTGAGAIPGATGSYKLTLELFPGEAGDSLGLAQVLPLGPGGGTLSVTGKIGDGFFPTRDVDLYRFQASAGTQVIASTKLPAGGTGMNTGLRLFDAAGNEIARATNAVNYSVLKVIVAAAGTYYLGVSGLPNLAYNPAVAGSAADGSLGDYDLSVTLVDAPADVGDTLATATSSALVPYTFGSWGHGGIIGNNPIQGARDVDLYRVNLGEGDSLSASTVLTSGGASGSLVLRLFNSSGQELASATGSPAAYPSLASYFSLTGGTYYVGVSGAPNASYNPNVPGSGVAGATSNYDLTLQLTPTFDIGNSRGDVEVVTVTPSAGYVRAFERLGNQDVGDRDVDIFRVNLHKGMALRARTLSPAGLNNSLDTVIRLFDSAGNEITRNDNGAGVGGGFSLLEFNIHSDDDYYIGISGAGNTGYNLTTGAGAVSGGPTGVYRLELSLEPFLEVGDTLATADNTLIGPASSSGGVANFTFNESVGAATAGPPALAGLKDVDLYRFVGGGGEAVTASTALPAAGGSIPTGTVLRLFNEFGAELARSTQTGGYGSLGFVLPRLGTYYLGVSGRPNDVYDASIAGSGPNASAPGDYTLNLTVQSFPFDFGDTLATASNTPFVGGVNTSWTDRDLIGNGPFTKQDVDLLRLNLAEGDVVNVTTLLPVGGVQVQVVMRLFDSAGTQIASALPTGTDLDESYPSLLDFLTPATGTYYLGISGAPNTIYDPHAAPTGFAGSVGSYQITINVQASPDAGGIQTSAVGTQLTPSAAGYTRDYDKLSGPDVDLYRFDAFPGYTLRARTANPFGGASQTDTLLRLFDTAGNQLAINDNAPGTLYSLLDYTFTAGGTYYLGVTGAGNVVYSPKTGVGSTNGAAGSYRLDMSLDVGDVRQQSVNIGGPGSSNFGIDGRVGDGPQGLKDVDFYAFEGFAGGVADIEVLQAALNPPSPQNTTVRLFDHFGQPLYIDTGGGAGLYTHFQRTLPVTGTYYIGISVFGNGGYDPDVAGSGVNGVAAGAYRLNFILTAPPDGGHTIATATPLPLGPGLGTVSRSDVIGNGALDGRDVDLFRFQATAGTQVVAATSLPFSGAKAVDTHLILFDSAGHALASGADISAGNSYSQLAFLIPATGAYYLGVSGSPNTDYSIIDGTGLTFGDTGDYRLTATLRYNGEISGTVFVDRNGDGARASSEGGLAGRTLYLDTNNNGALDPGEVSTQSGDDGSYRFTDLAGGNYTVRQAPMSNFNVTAPAGGAHSIALAPGQAAAGKDFADDPQLATVAVSLWQDFDSDGLRDLVSGSASVIEPGFADALALLGTDADGIIAAAFADAAGNAYFDNVAAGQYFVQVLKPDDNYRFSPQDLGSDEALDSDLDPGTGKSDAFTISGQAQVTITGGLAVQPQVQGTPGDDTFYLRLDSTGQFVQVYLGDQPTGTPAYTLQRAALSTLTIDTYEGNDTLYIDLSQGNPTPLGGLVFNGGDDSPGAGDHLVIRGDNSSATYTPSLSFPGGGAVEVGGKMISFTGVEPVEVNHFAVLTYRAPLGAGADDQVTLDTFAGKGRISGATAGASVPALTPLGFESVNQLIVDTGVNDGPAGAGDDLLRVGPTGIAAPGLTSISFRAGVGANTLSVGGGNVTIDNTLADGGTLSVLVENAGILNVRRSLELASLALTGTARLNLISGSLKTFRVHGLSVAPSAVLDVSDNDLIVYTPNVPQTLAQIRAAITSGAIQSSTPDPHQVAGVFALGNDDGTGHPVLPAFGGYAVGADAVLVQHTYDGDFDFNGKVNIDDYFQVDRRFAAGQATADEYFAIDKAFVKQQGSFGRGTMGQTADGWTTFTPAPDSRIVYVSSSLGSDANDGLSEATPVKTLAKAQSLVRNDMPDWILLKRGDVWTGERFAGWNKGGRAPQEPMLISAYGTGAQRPLIQYGGPGPAFQAIDGSDISYLAIVGIHFQGIGPTPGAGLDRTSPGDGFLLEDSVIDKFSTGMSIQGFYSRVHDVTIRRSVIADNFPIVGHAQGIYMNEVSGILIEENVIDHNGWKNPDRSDATIFNHNIYIAADNDGLVVRRNVIANASSHGLQARPGGIIQNNVFVSNPIGMSFGLVNGADVTPGGVGGEVSGNVFLEATDINAVTRRGWGIEVSNITPGVGASIKDNIFAHDQGEGQFAAIQLAVPSGATNPQDAVGIHDLLIEGNTVYKFDSALSFSNRLIPAAAGVAGFDDITVKDNQFQTALDAPYLLTHFPNYIPSLESWSGNVYYGTQDMGTWFRLGEATTSFAQWFSSVEPTARAAVTDFADPNRSVESYAATLGLPGTLDSFLAAARGQSRLSWSDALAAPAVLDYIRGGFAVDGFSQVPVPNGLSATYYDNPDFTNPKVSRTDADVNFTWWLSPLEEIGLDDYSVTWAGQIEPQFSETYTFYLTSNDGARLWIDGKPLIDSWDLDGTVTDSATITLQAGRKYAIGIEMYDHLDQGVARLEWESASQGRQVVPGARLYVPPPPTPPLKLMALGDSLTASSAGHASWRYWFDKQLDYGGYAFDMVGRNSGVSGGAALYGNFDAVHEAYPGLRADQILSQISTYSGTIPDVVLLEAGTQDVLAGQDNASTAAELGQIIDALRAINPGVKVALAQLPPISGKEAQVAALNTLIASLAAGKTSAASPVVLADLSAGYLVASDTYDGVNPSASGEKKIAASFFSALERLAAGVGGGGGGPHPAPTAPPLLTAKVISANRVDLSWADASHDETGFRIERRIGAAAWQGVASVAANVAGYSDRSLAPSTTYEYRVIALGNSPDSAPSPAVSATTTNLSFFRGINLGGQALSINGNAWDGSGAAGYTTDGTAISFPSLDLSATADPATTAMIRTAVYKASGLNLAIQNIPAGVYQVYLHTVEDSFQQFFNVSMEGATVLAGQSTGPVGTWQRLGPLSVAVSDGTLNILISGGEINLSGIEIWKVG